MPTPAPSASPPHPPRSPAGRLLGLTLVVLLAHWAVLRAAPLALAAHEARDAASSAVAFTTRTIAAPAPPPQRPASGGEPGAHGSSARRRQNCAEAPWRRSPVFAPSYRIKSASSPRGTCAGSS